jgi:glycosyltransferase involved in cell wall biosynthesis
MMRIAFYAPLKWPGHPIPSGDRLLARMFVAALAAAGHDVVLASRLRAFDGGGDAARQARIAKIGAALAQRLIRRWQHAGSGAPDLWFTYHVYHKAPDHLGQRVARALGIPYVIAEASIAPRQRDGAWREGHRAAAAAIRDADAVICVNPADVPHVAAARGAAAITTMLPPFCDVAGFVAAGATAEARAAATALAPPRDSPRLVTVAMMRPGDKLASYLVLADALERLRDVRWHLVVVGGGSAAEAVRTRFAALGPERVTFVGTQPPPTVAALVGGADLFVWPAVAEVIGLALLEAQACGVPVVAGRRPGVAAIVADGVTGRLTAPGDAAAFAAAVRALLDRPEARSAMARQARDHAFAHHDLAAASRALDALLAGVAAAHGAAA